MSLGLRLASTARRKLAAVTFATGALLAALAYQLPTRLDLDLGDRFFSALATDGFHDAENGYRWTRARSTVVFPDPGARRDAVVVLMLSGFRPRGVEPPLLVIEAGDRRLRVSPSRRVASYELLTRTEGLWSSSLPVSIQAETFTPGRGDDRALGVRVHRAELVLGWGAVPPLRQLLSAGALSLCVFLLLSEKRPGAAFAGAALSAAVAALGYALLRLHTAALLPVLSGTLALAVSLRWLAPSFTALSGDAAGRALEAATAGAGKLLRGAVFSGLAASVALTTATLLAPRFTIDLGSGEASLIGERFGAADADSQGVRFREALPGASLRLGDFGWGSPWRVSLRARLASGEPFEGTLARLDGTELAAALGRTWGVSEAETEAPGASWGGGPKLVFPGLGPRRLDVASVRVDRGRSLPAPRTLAFGLMATLALLVAFRSAGLPASAATAGAAAGALLLAAGVGVAPVVVTPFVPTIALGAGAAALLAAGARGGLDALAARDLLPPLRPGALAVSAAAFVLWFTASASPLYEGGHFAYHSSVAQEIWNGRFLTYYLPGPDNMLARQPQWGNLLVPHPCLFHTLAAPLAALPTAGFHVATKLFLAWLLFGIAVAAALVAEGLGGGRASLFAAFVIASSPIGFQLLGLGHLMTILGCWAATLALGFLALSLERLSERRISLGALALLTLCFVSYTGSLLFASMAIVAAAAVLLPSDRSTARRLAGLLVAAWTAALLLYYGNWVVPFLTDSVPALLGGSTSHGTVDFGARLLAEPAKLTYTFGSWLVPLAGLSGLVLGRGKGRVILGAWASVLVLVSLLDVGFNFLLKHHYFSLPAIAVGASFAADRFWKKGLWARGILVAVLALLLGIGLREAFWVAGGGA